MFSLYKMAVLEYVGQSEPWRNEHGFQVDCKLASLDELNIEIQIYLVNKRVG